MPVIAKFTYDVKPGRMKDFVAKLVTARSPEFSSSTMPKSVRLFRSTVPGPETRYLIVMIEYEDMAEYGARTDFENNHQKWRELFAASPDSPAHLVRVELLTEFNG